MAESGLSHVSCTLFLVLFAGYSIAEAPSTLRLVHVIYRHGDRSPTQTFPTDKHQENTWPQGFGQLTQMGMRQEYRLGKAFRNFYNGFLNETYLRQEIYIRSTDKDRTLMSAYTNLAGLYPPKGAQIWNDSIHWQPIPVHTIPYARDNLLVTKTPCPKTEEMMENVLKSFKVFEYEAMNKFLRVSTPCKYYEELQAKTYMVNPEVLHYEKTNEDFLNMVRLNAGIPNATLYQIMELVPGSLLCEKMHNLSMPEWVTDDVYDRLQELKAFQTKLWFYTPEMQRIRGGVLMKEIVNHTKSKVAGDMDPRRKMIMYSAHDTTLSVLLITLNTWDGQIPPYASALIFELHQRPDQSYFVRFLYKNDSLDHPDSEPFTLSIRGCEHDCDLDKFLEVVKPTLYDGDWFADCANKQAHNTQFSGTPIIAAVTVIIILVILLVLGVICYRKKTIIAYQSANFSAETASE